MTAYATRSPLQLLTNTHYMMAEQRSSERRTSPRIKHRDDVLVVNGAITRHVGEKERTSEVPSKKAPNGTAIGKKSKRKIGRLAHTIQFQQQSA
jgi:hypothetical protein